MSKTMLWGFMTMSAWAPFSKFQTFTLSIVAEKVRVPSFSIQSFWEGVVSGGDVTDIYN
jgi:hypothetical protein